MHDPVARQLVDQLTPTASRRVTRAGAAFAVGMFIVVALLVSLIANLYQLRAAAHEHQTAVNERQTAVNREVNVRLCAIVTALADPNVAPNASTLKLRDLIDCPVPVRR